jgi:hypothetical protein
MGIPTARVLCRLLGSAVWIRLEGNCPGGRTEEKMSLLYWGDPAGASGGSTSRDHITVADPQTPLNESELSRDIIGARVAEGLRKDSIKAEAIPRDAEDQAAATGTGTIN